MIAKTFAYPIDVREPLQGPAAASRPGFSSASPMAGSGCPTSGMTPQTEATLDVAGSTIDVELDPHRRQPSGRTTTSSPTPTSAKDATRQGETMTPIGPKARHLNRDFAYATGPKISLRTGPRRAH